MITTRSSFVNAGLWAAMLLILFTGITGCITEKKQRKITNKFLKNHPLEGAKYCADSFPIISSVDTIKVEDSSKYLKAKANYEAFIDSLAEELAKKGDSVIYKDKIVYKEKGKAIVLPCLDSTYYINTIKESTARLALAEGQIALLENQRDAAIIDVRGKEVLIAAKDAEIKQFKEDKKSLPTLAKWFVLALLGKWWFWLILVLVLIIVFRKLIVKFIPGAGPVLKVLDFFIK